jgi:hypothetical protein
MSAVEEITVPNEGQVRALGEFLHAILEWYAQRHPEIDVDVETNALLGVIYTNVVECDGARERARMVAACRHFFDRTVTADDGLVAHFRALFEVADAAAQGHA